MKDLFGIIPYLVSPVDDEGKVKTDVFQRLCSDLIDDGVHGLCVMGSSGEFPYLSRMQKETLVQAASEVAEGRVPVVAGVAGFSIAEAVEEASKFVSLGADAIVLMLEEYFPLSLQRKALFYKTVAQAVPDTSIIIYSNPKFMHYELTDDVFGALVDVPNIRYYKEAGGVTGKLLSLSNKYPRRFQIFSASAHIPLFVSMLGGVGWMAGPACLIPKQCVQLYNLSKSHQWDEAMSLQKSLWAANEVFVRYGLTGAVKAGLEHLGYPVGNPIPPLAPVSPEARLEIARVIDKIRSL